MLIFSDRVLTDSFSVVSVFNKPIPASTLPLLTIDDIKDWKMPYMDFYAMDPGIKDLVVAVDGCDVNG